MTKHNTDIMTREAIEFGEWLCRVAVPALVRERRRLSERDARALTLQLIMEVEDVVVATTDYTAAADDEVSLKAGDIVEVLDTKSALGAKKPRLDPELDVLEAELLDVSAAKHKSTVRPKKNHPRSRPSNGTKADSGARWLVRVLEDMEGSQVRTRQGWVPAAVLKEPQAAEGDQAALAARRQAVVRELVETEEEFGRDIQQVVTRYMRPTEKATTPKQVFDNRELLFSNFRQIAEFHNTVLLEGIKYYAGEPRLLGRALLRMEREFDKHVAYCRDEPLAQHLLATDPVVNKYFQDLADELGDDKGVTEHLKLPIQRINDYQLLLKELVKYSKRLGEDCTDLQKALDLFLSVPNRATDNKFIASIEGYRGNIYKLGRLLTHDWFTVTDAEGKARERYLFLFKARILVCKVKKVSDDRSVFVLKDIVKLPEVEVKDLENPFKFELHQKNPPSTITLTALKEPVKVSWLAEIRQHASDVVALAEHAADDLQVLSPPRVTSPEPPEEKKKKREHTEDVQAEAEEIKEKRTKVEEAEIQILTREESLQQLKAKRKASVESGIANKISKSEITDTSSVSEVQESKVSSAVKSEVTTDIGTKSSVTAVESSKETQSQLEQSSSTESKVTEKNTVAESSVLAQSKLKVEEEEFSQSSQKQSVDVNQSVQSSCIEQSSQEKLLVGKKSVEQKSEQILLAEQNIEQISQESEQQVSSSAKQKSNAEQESLVQQTTEQNSVLQEVSLEQTKSTRVSDSLCRATFEAQKVVSTTGAEFIQEAIASDQTVTTEAVVDDEMTSRYSRSSRKSGEYSSSTRKASAGGRYESSNYESSGLSSYSSRRESGSRVESGKIEIGSSIDGNSASRYESKYSSATVTEGGSKYGIESSYETKIEGTKFAIDNDGTSKIDSIASKYGIESNYNSTKIEGRRSSKYGAESSYESKVESGSKYAVDDSESISKIDSIASKYGRETNFEGRRSSKYGSENDSSIKIEGMSTKIETNYDSGKNGDVYERKYSRRSLANGSVTGEYEALKSVKRSESYDGRPVFKKTLEGQNIEPGDNATFECTLEESTESVRVTWLKDNKPLADRLMDRVNITTTKDGGHKLEVQHCREDDSGLYSARAENVKGNTHCTAQLVVQELTAEERRERNALNAPYFVVALKDTEIMENTYLRFMVRVKGDPNPEVKFYRDGKEIASSSDAERVSIVRTRAAHGYYELVIADVRPADAGRYSCRAMNIYGDVTTEAVVTVVDDKNIFGELPPGGEGLLAKGEKPQFTWKRDGQPFDPEERFKVLLGDDEDSLALVFQHVRPEDAGLYTCVAKTSTGNISCSAELTVQGAVHELHREPEKPTLVVEHREAVVAAGATAVLELVCRGYPKPQLLVKHQGQLVEADHRHKFLYEDDESMSLVIKSVTSADAGEYQVTASNELGEDTTTMHLLINAAPKIKKKIENQTCMVGSTHTVRVEVEGSPAPTLTVYKDGAEIKGSDRIVVVKESEEVYTITIRDAKLTDTGSYSVVVKNEVNQCSDFWQWHVTSPPRILKKLGGERVCEERETVAFQVQVEAEPEPTVKWFKNKSELTESSAVKMESSGAAHSLTITSAARADAGEYSCEVRNVHGSASDSCLLRVRGAPVLTRRLSDASAPEGAKHFEFTVAVEAYPEPKVQWYLGDVEITEKKSVFTRVDEGNTHKLILKEVSAELAGRYSCKVSNELGADSCDATFTVNRKPRITKSLVDMTVEAGTTLKLEVEVEGCPEPRVKWFKDGKEVNTDARIKIERDTHRLENYHLTVTLVKEEDGGEYEVTADNEMGSVSSKSTVTVHTREVHSRFKKETIDENELEDELKAKSKLIEEEETKQEKQKAQKSKTVAEIAEEKSFWDDIEQEKDKKVSVKDIDKPVPEEAKKSITEPEIADEKSFWDDVKEDEKPKKSETKDVESPATKKAKKSITEPEILEEKSFWNDANENETNKKTKVDEPETPISRKAKKSITEPEVIEEKSIWDDMDNEGQKPVLKDKKKSSESEMKKSEIKPEIIEEKSIWDDMDEDGKPKIPKEESVKTPSSKKGRKSITEPEIAEEKSIWDENQNEVNKKVQQDEIPIKTRKAKKSITEPEVIEEISVKEEIISPKRKSIKKESVIEEPLSAETEAPPTVKDSNMKDGHVYESLPLMYTVQVVGVPKPTVRWLHDGKEVEPSARVHINNEGDLYKLEIDSVEMDDGGKWQCEVMNDVGKKVQTAELSVSSVNEFRKPIFTSPLEAVSALQREPVTLRAVCTADPRPHVAWLLNGHELAPSASILTAAEDKEIEHGLKECTFTLHIPTGRHTDTGTYTIKAKNQYGVGESSARLDILLRPEIEGLKDVTAAPYEETTFVANIHANPIAEVQWSKDGYVIQPSAKHDVLEDKDNETYKLVVKNISVEDGGAYMLTAKNEIGETAQQVQLNVHTVKPTFTKTLQKQSVKDYEDCSLKVRCDGVPKPEVHWYRDGEEIVNDDRHTITTELGGQLDSELHIQHFNASDAGKYKVVAVNMAGEAVCEAPVSLVQSPPGFAHRLERQRDVDEGEPLELKAKLDGSPVPAAKWYKDGAELSPDDARVQLTALPDGCVKLRIERATPADCGAYKLVISNPNGDNSALCAVAVNPTPRKPSFSEELSDTRAVVGQPLRLEARVMAFPAPEVKWFKDGLPLRPSQAVSFINQPGGLIGLTIDSCKPEDAGVYSLTVTNKLGEVASKAAVEVQQKEKKPAFLAELQPTTVIEGFPAKMEVKLLGHPPPTVKWTLNGKELVPDGTHVRVVAAPDGTHALLLDRAGAADAGRYAAVAVNDRGETVSTADLTVASRADDSCPQERPRFVHGLRNMTAEEGQPFAASAPFVANPVPDVTWSKDGVPLLPSERLQLTCDGKRVGLEISSMEMADAGVYSISLVNPLGEDSTQGEIAVRKVYQPPRFSQKFTDLQQLPTFDAKFPARVVGVPAPEITWYRDGQPLAASAKHHMKRDGDACCLYVRDLEPADAGEYRCEAANREGSAACAARLDVVDKIARMQKMEPPTFLKKIGDIEVYRGMSAKFTACATGTPDPDVEWFRNDEKLFPCERIRMDKETTGLLRLTISGVDPSDVGAYRCRIYNPHGEDSCTAHLTYDTLEPKTSKRPLADQYSDFDKMKKTGIPMPLSDKPIISRMADRHLTLSWKPSIPHGPRFPVTYQVEMCEQPDGDWFTARSGLRSCACDIRNLEPFRDYKFRIRVENKYGVSDPSPYAATHRAKLEPDPPKFVPYLEPGIDFRPETSPYFPKDFDIERPPHDGYAQPPKFLRQEYDSQYGVKGHNVNLFWFVYGYPKPKMTYYFNDEPIEVGGRYDWSYTRNGQATLFINKMLERDAGWYEAVATNEHGQARQRVRLELAEHPTFIRRPEETVVLQRRGARLEARVTGVPRPDVKWYKDWQPLAPSARVKMQFVEPDLWILSLNDAILKDEGLYSVSARNVAGAVSSSAMLHVEESEHEYQHRIREHPPRVKPSTKPFGDLYDLGDELGRGVQGVVYHAAERLTGRNYAAKIMHGDSALKPFMKNELEIMNLLNDRHLVRLHGAHEHDHTLALVVELAAGGELVRDRLLRGAGYTERDVAGYVRQALRGLKHMHDNSVAHLGLTIGELLLSHSGSDDLKLCDFGLSRRIQFNKHATLDYGMPEYVAPEVASGEGVSFAADMWSLGIITYILLSGHSPFRGRDDRETLTLIREGKWEWHDEEWWSRLSVESRDFISKLLTYSWHERMDVNAALAHPWLTRADRVYHDEYVITTDRLRNYYNLYRDWTGNAQCRTWFRRRPLSGAYEHPSRMVYPPGETYTPEGTPERERGSHERNAGAWDLNFKQWDHPDWEVSAESVSHYQNGPDTYLLQLRDVDFPVRLREYMKVACHRSPGYSLNVFDTYDPRTPIIRERRRFTDIMDEEIDDERRERINNYGASSYTIRRLRHELGTRLDSYAEADALMEAKRDGRAPFFREKPQPLAVREGEPAVLRCYAVGEPRPAVQWFKNDMVLAEGQRVKITEDEDGRSTLSFDPAMHHDVGFYKVVARNKVGQTVARTRIVEATAPDAPDSPTAAEVSDTEVLLRWKQPKYDGNSPVVCYSLQYKEGDSVEWKDVARNIDHEFYVVRNLQPNTSYQFRLSSRNRIGWSDKGIPTNLIKTKEAGAPKIEVTKAMKHLQQMTEAGQEIVLDEEKPKLDYSTEENPIEWDSTDAFTERYSFISELWRGKYSIVVKGVDRKTDSVVVSKILANSPETEELIKREFECLRRLRHERISNLIGAYRAAGSPVASLVMEKLQGADVLSYLASRHDYTEQTVAAVVTQVLDALQYLHWRGYCHLDLQPDNVVMASVRAVQVKLVDFGSAHRVTKLGTSVPQVGELEYKAPEIISDEPAYPQTDVWSLGVLTYIMLSGVSPFRGQDDAETKQNIVFVRYRFEHLYSEITQEATRFLMFLFKKVPLKRPSAEECYEHRWLAQSDFMNKKRERAVFLGNRLKAFSDEYHERKAREASQADSVSAAFGHVSPRHLTRSNSIQDELLTNTAFTH